MKAETASDETNRLLERLRTGERAALDRLLEQASHYEVDFSDVRGQEHVKRSLLVAAAGRHNVLTL